ncbi:nucleoporin NUP35-like [Glandiceps talaboti]
MDTSGIHSGQEPMTMGSPVGISSHPQPYLPGYLMGDPAISSPSPSSSVRLWSHSSSSSPPQSRSSVTTPQSSVFKDSRSEWTPNRPPVSGMTGSSKEKSGAPPVAPLFEPGTPNRQTDLNASLLSGSVMSRTPLTITSPMQGLTSPGAGLGSRSPAQIDPFFTQGEELEEEQLDDTWVTIFGFPPAAASFILQQFSQYGNITRHVMATNGNWMHIQYSSRIQAKIALSKNGKVFGNSIMVGVTFCIEKSAMQVPSDNVSISTPSQIECHKSPAIRPLTAAYQAASSPYQVAPSTNAPEKNAGVVSRAMEYMFGW